MYNLFPYVIYDYTRVNRVKNMTPSLKWVCEGLTLNFSPFSFENCTLVTLRQNFSFVQSACNWKSPSNISTPVVSTFCAITCDMSDRELHWRSYCVRILLEQENVYV